MPPIGNQPVRAAINTINNDVNSGGSDSRTSEAPRITCVITPARRLPVRMPSGRPISVAAASAVTARIAVLAARSRTSVATGVSYSHDRPKSKRTACAIQSRYWSAMGRLSPYCARARSTASGRARSPSSATVKSPGASRASTSDADDTRKTSSVAKMTRRIK